MTDYNAILDTQIEPDAPLTSQLGSQLRDNPIAQNEGANDAPYSWFSWHPYNGVNVGDGIDGAIYDFAVDGAVASVASPAFAEGFEYRFVFDGVSNTSGANFRFTAAYSTGGSSTPTPFTIGIPATRNVSGFFDVERAGVAERAKFWRQGQFTDSIASVAEEASTTPGTLYAINRSATPFRITSITLTPQSGNFDAGKILMLRRRVYV